MLNVYYSSSKIVITSSIIMWNFLKTKCQGYNIKVFKIYLIFYLIFLIPNEKIIGITIIK